MSYLQIFEISASGLDVQKARLEAAASNLANMQTVDTGQGAPYQPVRVISRAIRRPGFDALLNDQVTHGVRPEWIRDAQVEPRTAYEPGNPYADKNGMVKYPGVNHLEQMVSINEALRAYEANLAALQAAKAMANYAIDMGGRS